MTILHTQPAAAPATTPGVGAAAGLVGQYRPSARTAFFASPTRTLLTEGVAARVPHGRTPPAARVAEVLAAADAPSGGGRPMVVGALPFQPGRPAALFVPERVRTGPALAEDPLCAVLAASDEEEYAEGHGDDGDDGDGRWNVRPVPAPEDYAAAVERAVRRLRSGELDKVVLARTLELDRERPLDLRRMLRRLAQRDPGGYTFALPAGGGRTLLGASPELLVKREGTTVVANPLAGSAPRSEDLAEDVRRASALLESPKDLAEHAWVVAAVRNALAPFCRRLTVPERPTLVRTAAMWHLSTTVTGEIAEPAGSTALDLASALHPTPAVCGTPTADARQAIGELEPFDRGLYTGMVGWQDASGEGEWVVTIRCAEAGERDLRLFAGAGIVADSDPQTELAETTAKFRTFLHAVGAEL
jgi:isochorismate synthase